MWKLLLTIFFHFNVFSGVILWLLRTKKLKNGFIVLQVEVESAV